MRRKLVAGVLMALTFLIPAAPAMAGTDTTGLNAACQTVDRTVYRDLRTYVTIDLDTAPNARVRLLATQMLAAALDESLPTLADAIQQKLDGTTDDLRSYLKSGVQDSWTRALRVAVGQTMTNAGTNVDAAAQKVLGVATIDAYLAYLNDDVYAARKLDCASHTTPPATVPPTTAPPATATATAGASSAGAAVPTGSPSAGSTGGGVLAITGTNTGIAVGIGGGLLLLGGVGYLLGRRRRSRFVA